MYVKVKDFFGLTSTPVGLFLLLFALVPISPVKSTSACTHISIDSIDATLIINTPNYPDVYPASHDKCWVVTTSGLNQVADEIYALKFRVVDLEMEASTGCAKDYGQVRDGANVTSSSLAKWCGTTLPNAAMTSGSEMYVTFTSDASDHTGQALRGFKIEIAVVVRAGNAGLASRYPNCDVMSLSSTSLQYIITSPGYPEKYPTNMNKCWVVLVSSQISEYNKKRVELTVVDSNLENDLDCEYDVMNVRDGDSAVSKFIIGWCGHSIPQVTVSCEQKMYISMKTNHVNSGRGFQATLRIADKATSFCADDKSYEAASVVAIVAGTVGSVVLAWMIIVACRAAYVQTKSGVRQTPVVPPTPMNLSRHFATPRPPSIFLHPQSPQTSNGPMLSLTTRERPAENPSFLSVSPYTVQYEKGYAEPINPGYVATTSF